MRAERYWKALSKVFECQMEVSRDGEVLGLIGAGERRFFRWRNGAALPADQALPGFDGVEFVSGTEELSTYQYEVLQTSSGRRRIERRNVKAAAEWGERTKYMMTDIPPVATFGFGVGEEQIELERRSARSVVVAVGISEDARHLLAGDKGGCVSVWSVEDGRLLCDFQVCRAPIAALAVSRDLRRVFFLTVDGFLGCSPTRSETGAGNRC